MAENREWVEVSDRDGKREWAVHVHASAEQDPRSVLSEIAERLTALLGR